MFINYKNVDSDSDIYQYEIGNDYVAIKFNDNPKIYKYSYAKAGQKHVDKMKYLAEYGDGLNSYILKYVRYKYDR